MDIFVRAFSDGDAADRDGLPVRRILLEAGGFREAALELIVAVARAADMVILPVGCPACLVFEHQRLHLPPDIAGQGVALVATGTELVAVLRGALPSWR